MNENIKEIILAIIVVSITILGAGSLISVLNKDSEQYRQKRIQEINECFEKTNDKDWCLNKFLE